jgi:hypothetical protein
VLRDVEHRHRSVDAEDCWREAEPKFFSFSSNFRSCFFLEVTNEAEKMTLFVDRPTKTLFLPSR